MIYSIDNNTEITHSLENPYKLIVFFKKNQINWFRKIFAEKLIASKNLENRGKFYHQAKWDQQNTVASNLTEGYIRYLKYVYFRYSVWTLLYLKYTQLLINRLM